jgi:peptidoglycan/LPS O-acetylase OafA/YrhL
MPSRSKDAFLPPVRYEGLDSFRVVGIYVVVLVHFQSDWAPQLSLGKFVELRGCAFPVILLTSFFVLSRSVLIKPQRGFGKFLMSRFKRIEIPFLIWTAIYYGLVGVIFPLRHGEAITWPSPALLLSGYMHLWFLQFIFLGSIILYPLLLFLASRKHLRWLFALSCLVASLSYAVWVRPFIGHQIQIRMAHADPSLFVFVTQVNTFLIFVPAALTIALYADQICALYGRWTYRILSLVLVVTTMSIHLMNDSFPFTKGLYSLAVFVALLQPLPATVVNALRPVVIYSYPIYILHFMVSHLVTQKLFSGAHLEATPANVLLGSIAVFGLSLLASVLLRRLFPRDWFLPLIPVRRRPLGPEPGRKPRALHIAPGTVNR